MLSSRSAPGFGEAEQVALSLWPCGLWAGRAGCGGSILWLGWLGGRDLSRSRERRWLCQAWFMGQLLTRHRLSQDLRGSPERLWDNNGGCLTLSRLPAKAWKSLGP